MSSNEILDSEPECSKDAPLNDSKEEDGISSSGECDDSPGKQILDSEPECTKDAPLNDSKEEDGISSSGECDDSPEPVQKSEDDVPEEIVSKKENCTSLRPMDGELDYEEEVCYDDKEKSLPKADDAESEKKENDEVEDDEDEKKDDMPENEEKKDEDDDEEEEGKIDDSPKESKEKDDGEKEDSVEEGEDEGEISDDDLEEGEVKDASPKPETTRQICRFYGRGQCFYGNACRFLHLNHNEKGQYNMFAPRYSPGYGYAPGNLMGPSNVMMSERTGPRMGMDYSVPPPIPVPIEPSPVESAWERGLREAKELVKKANKRKEEEPDFDKKKLNLSIHVNEKNTPDFDKENEYFFSRQYTKRNDGHFKKYEEPCDMYENDRIARDHFRGGRYENFEIRYTREDMPRDRRPRERSRGRMSTDRERYPPKEGRNKDRLKDDREFDIQMRTRAFEYVDPWRRSKTPKARHTRSRSGSYSSVSSYSYSDRSSRSSSYSRSSSRSSAGSSRSPSVMHKRKPSPVADAPLSPKGGTSRFPLVKKKPATRPATGRSSTSRSRSASRTPSISRSRSYSRSISMDSVSSASSSVSHSSSASESRRNRGHGSLLRKNDEKLPLEKLDSRNLSATSYDREDGDRDQNVHDRMYPSEVPATAAPAFPSFQHLLPGSDSKNKSQHKQPIKLTLLSKSASSKATSFPKKELDRSKLVADQKTDSSKQDTPGQSSGTKRPLSPTLSAVNTKSNSAAAAIPKKSASSRRDELLKQLKAVEDAIARKRAKFC